MSHSFMNPSLIRSQCFLFIENRDVSKITRQHQSEKAKHIRHNVDHQASWLKGVGIDLYLGLPVAYEPGDDQQNSPDRRTTSKPGSTSCSAGGGALALP